MRLNRVTLTAIAVGGSIGFLAARIPPIGPVLDAQAAILVPELIRFAPVLAVLVVGAAVVYGLLETVSGIVHLIARLVRRRRARTAQAEVPGDR